MCAMCAPRNDPDHQRHSDIDAYLATLPPGDEQELLHADLVVVIVTLLERSRGEPQGGSAGEAWGIGFWEAIARFQEAGGHLNVATLQKYLDQMGYDLRLGNDPGPFTQPVSWRR